MYLAECYRTLVTVTRLNGVTFLMTVNLIVTAVRTSGTAELSLLICLEPPLLNDEGVMNFKVYEDKTLCRNLKYPPEVCLGVV